MKEDKKSHRTVALWFLRLLCGLLIIGALYLSVDVKSLVQVFSHVKALPLVISAVFFSLLFWWAWAPGRSCWVPMG
ncbi:MAG: hypothetical protein RDV48_10180 [Candidatus Eremiobacteraeota bacterium]|nr:hypothetical protein [Candidatus Eremiobacteraeota bacterium]